MLVEVTHYHIHTVGPDGSDIDRSGSYKVKNPAEDGPIRGTDDYDELKDKPSIDGVTLIKGLTAKEMGLENDMDPISAKTIDTITGS